MDEMPCIISRINFIEYLLRYFDARSFINRFNFYKSFFNLPIAFSILAFLAVLDVSIL